MGVMIRFVLPILEIRHIECEPPAGYQQAIDDRADTVTVRIWREPLPADPSVFAGIIVMGGPMGVGDAATIPWVADEIAFLRAAIEADVPIWGVCLGSQMLAAALGADITTGDTPEVGVSEVTLADAAATDPVFADLPERRFEVLHWHSDTFAIPAGGTLLASTDLYPAQVFRHGHNYGVQFHLEADVALATQWFDVDEYRIALESALGPGGMDRLLDGLARIEERPLADTVMRRWLNLIAG